MKLCRGCMTEKAGGEFSKNASSPDGLHSRCKACRTKARVAPNHEKEAVRLSAYYQANREELLERRKERYRNNREAELLRNKAWSDSNREKHRELNRQWSKKNPEEARALVARRRSRLAGAVGNGYGKADIDRLMADQGGKCLACQCDLSDSGFNVDHIMPIALGGANDPANIQLLCPTCNRSKGAKHPNEWNRQRTVY